MKTEKLNILSGAYDFAYDSELSAEKQQPEERNFERQIKTVES